MKDAIRYINYVRTSAIDGKDLDEVAIARDIEASYEIFKDRIVGLRAVAVPMRLIEGFPDDSYELRQGKGLLFEDGSVLITFYDSNGDISDDSGVLTLDLDDQADRLTLQTIVRVSRIMYSEVPQEEQP